MVGLMNQAPTLANINGGLDESSPYIKPVKINNLKIIQVTKVTKV